MSRDGLERPALMNEDLPNDEQTRHHKYLQSATKRFHQILLTMLPCINTRWTPALIYPVLLLLTCDSNRPYTGWTLSISTLTRFSTQLAPCNKASHSHRSNLLLSGHRPSMRCSTHSYPWRRLVTLQISTLRNRPLTRRQYQRHNQLKTNLAFFTSQARGIILSLTTFSINIRGIRNLHKRLINNKSCSTRVRAPIYSSILCQQIHTHYLLRSHLFLFLEHSIHRKLFHQTSSNQWQCLSLGTITYSLLAETRMKMMMILCSGKTKTY